MLKIKLKNNENSNKNKIIGCFDFLKKEEEGNSGIHYAMYFIGIITTIVLFLFLKFNADLYMIEQALENGLHIAEMRVLTATQDGVDVVNGRADDYERELSRMHIITAYTEGSGSPTGKELEQIKLLAKEFTTSLNDQLGLENGNPTQNEMLKHMSGSTAEFNIKSMKIYEPVYKRTISKKQNGLINGTNVKLFDFEVKYEVTKWLEYTFNFNGDNVFTSCQKRVITDMTNAPRLKNGTPAEGATLEVTLGAKFYGVRSVFASTSSSNLSGSKNTNTNKNDLKNLYDKMQNDSYVTSSFYGPTTQNIYDVEITQAVDIVISHQDSRKQ